MFFRSRLHRRTASALYLTAVDAARAPEFYAQCAVPDTVEGRYEMIVLHVTLLLRRLRRQGEGRAALAQAVVDYMAADLDRSIRELGVGDLSVGKFMKRLGEGLYGRAAAYDGALDSGDGAQMRLALLRNIYDGYDPGNGGADGDRILAAFALYVEAQWAHLSAQAIEAIAGGKVEFLPPRFELRWIET